MAILAIPKHVRDGNLCRRARFWDKVSFICNVIMESESMKNVTYTAEVTTKIVEDYTGISENPKFWEYICQFH